MHGAGNRIRTDDLRITNALLYQLSYPGNEPDNFQCFLLVARSKLKIFNH